MNNRLPLWFRQEIPDNTILKNIHRLSDFNLNTVCQEARCPNLGYCFKRSKFTFIILGDVCTRSCGFCAVKKSSNKALYIDLDEPYRIAKVVKELGLDYVIITSVTRDDLNDGGAGQFTKTIELIYAIDTNIKVEVLIPDFKGNTQSIKTVISASPNVVAHNIETVSGLYNEVRPEASYQVSLEILRRIKEEGASLITKSSMLLGMGETEEEVVHAMEDLRASHCDILTLGQYLAPSKKHYPVKKFISIEQFKKYEKMGYNLGFKALLSGPLVRSSYRADEVYRDLAAVSCL